MDENLFYQNINNLTALWKDVAILNGKYKFSNGLHLAVCPQSQWPNRLWFDAVPDDEMLNKSIALIKNTHSKIRLSTFQFLKDLNIKGFEKLMLKKGFTPISKQYGMCKEVEEFNNEESTITFHKVINEKEVLLWVENFQSAFNYQITPSQILLSLKGYDCFLVLQNNEIIGCCMCFSQSPEIIGFHSFAVHPKFQRKGLGIATMRAFMNDSAKKGYKYIVLQSSENAHSLYQQLGFNEQFLMLNFELKANE